MPYNSISQLPENVKTSLTPEEEKQFLAVFNSVFGRHGDETSAFKVAWAAVNKPKKKDAMDEIRRYDSVAFSSKPTKTSQGFLKVSANLSRTGVFVYTNADGSKRRELRHPDEVFKTEVMDSLQSAPVTFGHPTDGKDYVLVNSKNSKKYTVGMLGEEIKRDDNFISGGITIMDSEAIEAVEKGHRREISLGYTCDLIPESGEFNGEKYDCRQTNISYNHAAIVPRGRAGAEVAIRMDSQDACTEYVTEINLNEEVKMETQTLHVDGVDYDLPKSTSQAIELALNNRSKELADIKAELDSTKGQFDAMKDELAKANQSRADAEDPKRIQEAVTARVELLSKASKVLGNTNDLSALNDRQVKEAVILNASPDTKFDSLSDDYVNGRFDMVVESHKATTESLANARRAVDTAASGSADKATPAQARQVKLDAYANAWKKTLNK